jgi:hypothetical protein
MLSWMSGIDLLSMRELLTRRTCRIRQQHGRATSYGSMVALAWRGGTSLIRVGTHGG